MFQLVLEIIDQVVGPITYLALLVIIAFNE